MTLVFSIRRLRRIGANKLSASGYSAARGMSSAVVGFAVISRRGRRRWTFVRGDGPNAESTQIPAAVLRPEAGSYHRNDSVLQIQPGSAFVTQETP